MFKRETQLVLDTVEQAVKLPERLLRALASKTLELYKQSESSDQHVGERLDALTQEMMTAVSDARVAVEMTGCAKKAAEEIDADRKRYLGSLLKGNPVSLNGRFSLESEEDVAVAGKFQDFLSTMDGVIIEEFDETMTRYIGVMPVNHPSLDLQFAVTRRELALDADNPSAADLNGIYYGIAFGTVDK